jgi:para-aminobenzoate synthetase
VDDQNQNLNKKSTLHLPDESITISCHSLRLPPLCGYLISAWIDPRVVFTRHMAQSPTTTPDTNTFWLDSSKFESDLSRFSFMGHSATSSSSSTSPHIVAYHVASRMLTTMWSGGATMRTVASRGEFWRVIDEARCSLQCCASELPFDFCGGLVGVMGYDMQEVYSAASVEERDTPDAVFMLVDRFIGQKHGV